VCKPLVVKALPNYHVYHNAANHGEKMFIFMPFIFCQYFRRLLGEHCQYGRQPNDRKMEAERWLLMVLVRYGELKLPKLFTQVLAA